MFSIVVVTRAALLIARRASTWTIDEHLGGQSPQSVAIDQRSPAQVYCGTARAGLFRSRDVPGSVLVPSINGGERASALSVQVRQLSTMSNP